MMSEDIKTSAAAQVKSTGRPRDRAKDAAILEAALELFIEEGIEGANFESIAKRAGTTRPAIYRRYASKEQLIASAIGHWRKSWEERLTPWESMSVEEAVATLTSPEIAQVAADPIPARLFARLIGSMPDHPELMATYWQHYVEPRRAAITHILLEARDKGQIRSTADIDILRDMVMGAVLWRLLLSPESSPQKAQDYFRRLLQEIGLRGKEGQ